MGNYKAVHVGGGGNCVLFSTAKQLDEGVHANIRGQLKEMYTNPETRARTAAMAEKLIQNQFGAGFANTSLNYELHGYKTNGAVKAEDVINKLTSTKGDDLNNVLSLRLMMQAKCNGLAHSETDFNERGIRSYLGKDKNGGVDIYESTGPKYIKDLLKVVSEAMPEGKRPPAIVAAAQLGRGYQINAVQMGEDGQMKATNMLSDKADSATISKFCEAGNIPQDNVLGLIGTDKHCKALVNTDVQEFSEDSCMTPVKEESRSTSRGIKGFFINIVNTIKEKLSSMFSSESKEGKAAGRTEASKASKADGSGKGYDLAAENAKIAEAEDVWGDKMMSTNFSKKSSEPGMDAALTNAKELWQEEDEMSGVTRREEKLTASVSEKQNEKGMEADMDMDTDSFTMA